MKDHAMHPADTKLNVSEKGRVISTLTGSLLLYYSLKKHKSHALMAIAGGFFVYRGLSGYCPLTAMRERAFFPMGRNINVRTHILVNRPRGEIYPFWRKLENLNLFMQHISHIREIDEKRSAWQIRIPGGLGTLDWEAEIVREEAGRELSWHSVPGSAIENVGKINFSDTPSKGTTRIDVLISYRAPFGRIGEGLYRLLTPLFKHKIEEDIRSFKYYMENKDRQNQNGAYQWDYYVNG